MSEDIIPYIVIAAASSRSSRFTFVPETYFDTEPFDGGKTHATHTTIVYGESEDLNVFLEKDTQIMICMGLKSIGCPDMSPTMGFHGGVVMTLA